MCEREREGDRQTDTQKNRKKTTLIRKTCILVNINQQCEGCKRRKVNMCNDGCVRVAVYEKGRRGRQGVG